MVNLPSFEANEKARAFCFGVFSVSVVLVLEGDRDGENSHSNDVSQGLPLAAAFRSAIV